MYKQNRTYVYKVEQNALPPEVFESLFSVCSMAMSQATDENVIALSLDCPLLTKLFNYT